MSRDESEGLNALFQDVMESDLPDPELLARYATAPNELTAEERDQVETAMRRSPIVVDELDTLRGFDFGALDADREGAGGRGRLGAWFISLLGQPVAWAGVAAAAALGLWVALGGNDGAPGGPERGSIQLVEESGGSEEGVAPDSIEPELVPPALDERTEQLVESESAQDSKLAPEPLEGELESVRSPETQLAESAPTPSGVDEPLQEPPGIPERGGLPDAGEGEASGEAPVEREILVAMVMPAYEAPIGVGQRGRTPFVYRGSSENRPRITALAPPHVAWSASAQPTLPWHIDRVPSEGAFYLTISDSDDEPLVENLRIPLPADSGVQGTSIAGLDVDLRRGVEYRWSIAHRLDEESPPTEYAFGWVEAVEMGGAIRDRVDQAAPGSRPDLLAREGYWYDALQATLDLVARHPLDDRPRNALRALLVQGGVSDLSL
jgi:Domain of Unknown Function (DUF928)